MNGIYILYFGDDQSVSVEFNNYRFSVNAPVFVQKETPEPIIPPPIAGGFYSFQNREDNRYKAALAYALE